MKDEPSEWWPTEVRSRLNGLERSVHVKAHILRSRGCACPTGNGIFVAYERLRM